MMAVPRYWESISNKTKILFSLLAKKAQLSFILDNMVVPTLWVIAVIKMTLYLEKQAGETAVVERNEGMNI